MKKITKKVKILSVLFALFAALGVKSQSLSFTVNNGVNYQCDNGGMNTAMIGVTSSPATTTSYSWSVISSPCGVTYTPAVSNASIINMSFPCAGMYSISCISLNGSTATGVQFSQFFIYANPTITISGPTSSICLGATATLSASGANTYTWSVGAIAPQIVDTPTGSVCYSVVGTSTQGCTGLASSCVTVQTTTTILISPSSQTVCRGSSANLTASGAANYMWMIGATTSSINVMPYYLGTTYTISGTASNGCIGTASANVAVDTTCVDVWPGDANSDGTVNNLDVLELGLSFSATGNARSPGGNSFTSQFANAWIGNGSTGKNRAHIDCNGDGTVNGNDIVAIYNNYTLTHAFKSSSSTAVDADISIVADQNMAYSGQWNKADILLGSSSTPMSQLYGVVFDLTVDQSFIEPNSYYLVYTSSFLNQNNQNVIFRKPDYSNNKLYAATVRTDNTNVNGNGKIAELWFRVKSDAPDNSVINVSLANGGKINNTGINTSLTSGSAAIVVTTDVTGIHENGLLSLGVSVFPNPAKDLVYLRSESASSVNYVVTDLLGKVVATGEFTKTSSLNTSTLSAGSYIMQFNSGNVSTYKKLVIEN